MSLKILLTPVAAVLAFFLSAAVIAEPAAPPVGADDLKLVKHTKLRAVYMKPGTNLAEYDKVALLGCYVAFKKDWQRNYNDQTMNLMNRITDQDMKNIREALGKEFDKVFIEVLKKGGQEIVDRGGDGVLVIQPAILNLEVTAPDSLTAGMQANFSASAGQMTLFMQLYDGKTGDMIARVIDPEAAGDDYFEVRNSVTNMADADRIIRRWATIRSDHLSKISAEPSSPAAQ